MLISFLHSTAEMSGRYFQGMGEQVLYPADDGIVDTRLVNNARRLNVRGRCKLGSEKENKK